MKLWFTGFFMAWGMFLAIPCPLRIWDERARRHMTRCLPLVGGLVGGLWALAAFLLRSAPAPIRALVLTLLPWLCTGFLHLDGYMDVSDAVLSRRDLATRQKILKDSHCGAFAVISMVLLALTQWSVFLSAAELPLLPLAMVPVAVRACAACAVLVTHALVNSAADRDGHAEAAVYPQHAFDHAFNHAQVQRVVRPLGQNAHVVRGDQAVVTLQRDADFRAAGAAGLFVKGAQAAVNRLERAVQGCRYFHVFHSDASRLYKL